MNASLDLKYTDDQLREAYPHLLWIHSCIERAGYQLKPALSEQDFIASGRTGIIWNPYEELYETVDDVALDSLFKDCAMS